MSWRLEPIDKDLECTEQILGSMPGAEGTGETDERNVFCRKSFGTNKIIRVEQFLVDSIGDHLDPLVVSSLGDDPLRNLVGDADDSIGITQQQPCESMGKWFVGQMSKTKALAWQRAVDLQDEGYLQFSSQVQAARMPETVSFVDEVRNFTLVFQPRQKEPILAILDRFVFSSGRQIDGDQWKTVNLLRLGPDGVDLTGEIESLECPAKRDNMNRGPFQSWKGNTGICTDIREALHRLVLSPRKGTFQEMSA